jgi:hypothetical protein
LKSAVQHAGYGIETTNPSPAPKGKSGCCG